MAFWASQLISRLFQGTSMLAHYCNNWKPAAEACLSDYPGSRLHEAAKSKKKCLDAYWYDTFRDLFFLITVRTCSKAVTTALSISHLLKKRS